MVPAVQFEAFDGSSSSTSPIRRQMDNLLRLLELVRRVHQDGAFSGDYPVKEAALVRQVISYFRARGILAWRNNSGATAYQSPGKKPRFVRFGLAGSPDIVAVDPNNGKIVCVECKSDSGKQSPEQKAFQCEVEKATGVYILARDLDEVIYYFDERRI